jgi:hypothetical protein
LDQEAALDTDEIQIEAHLFLDTALGFLLPEGWGRWLCQRLEEAETYAP